MNNVFDILFTGGRRLEDVREETANVSEEVGSCCALAKVGLVETAGLIFFATSGKAKTDRPSVRLREVERSSVGEREAGYRGTNNDKRYPGTFWRNKENWKIIFYNSR